MATFYTSGRGGPTVPRGNLEAGQGVLGGMTERVLLPVFFFCLVACASMVLVGIWAGKGLPPAYFQTAASLFVIGLATFLSWFTLTLRAVCKRLKT